MIARRDALALLGGLVATACATARPRPKATPPPTFGLDPVVDLIPAARLVWLVEARPRELLEHPRLGPIVGTIAPPGRLDAFARFYGGIDVRRADEVALAGFDDATLGVARVPVDVDAAAALTRRSGIEGHASDRGVARFWGTASGEPERLALFGREGAALERGKSGPLDAAVYFAQGRLKRALPALKSEPLLSAAKRLGDAPLRGFAPGPFEEPWASGLGGLLRAATAIAIALRPVEGMEAPATPAVHATWLLLGAWGADAPGAAARFGAAFHVLSEDPLGRLTGLDRTINGVQTTSDPGMLRLDTVVDVALLVQGLRNATQATVSEMMGR